MTQNPARFLHLSNSVTYFGLLSAVLAIWFALETGSVALSGSLLALSVLADTLDGRFARMFDRGDDMKRFGRQIDSLSDAVCFGIAPVICISVFVSTPNALASTVWLLAAFVYVLSTVTRLAAYNLQAVEDSDFIGLPAPVAGLVWTVYLLVEPSWVGAIITALLCGVAMLWPIRIPRPTGIGLYAFMFSALVLAIVHGMRWAIPVAS